MSKPENRLEKLLACLFAHAASSTGSLGLFKSGPIQIDEEPYCPFAVSCGKWLGMGLK
jgi:hypothetical protein